MQKGNRRMRAGWGVQRKDPDWPDDTPKHYIWFMEGKKTIQLMRYGWAVGKHQK